MTSQSSSDFPVNQDSRSIPEATSSDLPHLLVPNQWSGCPLEDSRHTFPWNHDNAGLQLTGINPRLIENGLPYESERWWEGGPIPAQTEYGWRSSSVVWPIDLDDPGADDRWEYLPEQSGHEHYQPLDWDMPVFPLSNHLHRKFQESMNPAYSPDTATHSSSFHVPELDSSRQGTSPTSYGETVYSLSESPKSFVEPRIVTESPDLKLAIEDNVSPLATNPR